VVSVSYSSRASDNDNGISAPFPGRFETAAHGHEPGQQTAALGAHPKSTLEGYTSEGYFQVTPRDASGDQLVTEWYRINEQHVVDLEDLR